MEKFLKKPDSITDVPFHYCPGCGHGIAHRLLGEVIDELNVIDKTIAVVPVGCAVEAYDYFECDVMAVSYTHLDVYKRQFHTCVSIPFFISFNAICFAFLCCFLPLSVLGNTFLKR